MLITCKWHLEDKLFPEWFSNSACLDIFFQYRESFLCSELLIETNCAKRTTDYFFHVITVKLYYKRNICLWLPRKSHLPSWIYRWHERCDKQTIHTGNLILMPFWETICFRESYAYTILVILSSFVRNLCAVLIYRFIWKLSKTSAPSKLCK